MAVTAIRGDVVWGGNRAFHLALIDACRGRLGATPFLDRFQRSFDHGNNCVDLEREPDEDVRAYRDCIAALVDDAAPLQRLLDHYGENEVRSALIELVDLIDRERLNAP